MAISTSFSAYRLLSLSSKHILRGEYEPCVRSIFCASSSWVAVPAGYFLATPYLRYIFQTIGLADFEAVHLEQMLRGEDAVERSQQLLARWQAGFEEQLRA
ncbi:hypothetical protein HSX11_23670 [Oxalobacteraceae bacterium]|nr:hypothetical protein [Oxalobacteraceae bacterium]